MNLVVDSSVIVKWFAKQDETDRPQALFIRKQFLSHQLNLIVPDLVLYEITNVLKTKKEVEGKDVRETIKFLFVYPFYTVSPSQALFLSALKIAYDYELTIYDAIYVALAQGAACSLITADKKLQSKCKSLDICLLKDFKI